MARSVEVNKEYGLLMESWMKNSIYSSITLELHGVLATSSNFGASPTAYRCTDSRETDWNATYGRIGMELSVSETDLNGLTHKPVTIARKFFTKLLTDGSSVTHETWTIDLATESFAAGVFPKSTTYTSVPLNSAPIRLCASALASSSFKCSWLAS